MKKTSIYFAVIITAIVLVASSYRTSTKDTSSLSSVRSISAITFGPDGILFIGDSKSASVFAVQTKDVKKQNAVAVDMKNIDDKIAASLGTESSGFTITDMAVNPISKNIYFAVQMTDGSPVLLKLNGDKFESITLTEIAATSVLLNNAPAEDAKDSRGRPMRISTISDMGYADGKLLVSGLSNHEFSSSFKSIPYPFTMQQDEATLEIYHAAHGRFETSAPIKTFTTGVFNNKKYLVASYTCTPLVLFPMDELKPGMHVKGRTVAEMGSGNTPIDMINIDNGNGSYLVLANTKHPVAKVDHKNISTFEGTLTEPVKGTAGVAFKATSVTDVVQMDKISDTQLLMLQRKSNGDLDLVTVNHATL